jgi:arsenite-transporting ATPase
LVVNGVFRASGRSDATAASLEDQGKQALSDMPASLRVLPRDDIWLQPREMMRLDALRSLLGPDPASQPPVGASPPHPFPNDLPAPGSADRLAGGGMERA